MINNQNREDSKYLITTSYFLARNDIKSEKNWSQTDHHDFHLADAFIQSDLQCIQAIHFFVSMCVPWELNPQPFALLTQCSTTEPQEHYTTNFHGIGLWDIKGS